MTSFKQDIISETIEPVKFVKVYKNFLAMHLKRFSFMTFFALIIMNTVFEIFTFFANMQIITQKPSKNR